MMDITRLEARLRKVETAIELLLELESDGFNQSSLAWARIGLQESAFMLKGRISALKADAKKHV